RTGDLARSLPSGVLEFLGRMDQQVKVRGFRIELGEIEAALLALGRVRDGAVLVRDEGEGRRYLAAYVVPEEGRTPSRDELVEALRRGLPDYMVPSVFVLLDALPLTPNGKVDRRALARLAPVPEAPGEGSAPPSTPTEELLAGIFADVLGRERIGVHDDFFALGGHSLLATRVVSRVRERLGVELPLRKVFEAPSVASLARELKGLSGERTQALPLRSRPGSNDLPLSFAQERLWFLDRFEPGGSLYNIPTAVRLEGALDEPAFAAALGEIVRRHETLRTAFREIGGRPVQRILPWSPFELPIIDLGMLPEGEREEAWRRLVREEAARPFDLASGRMLRALLLRFGEREHVVALTFHHIASDGWSFGVFLRELQALYKAASTGRPSPLPGLPMRYADFAVCQREWLQGEVLESQLAWWRQALAGLPEALELPTDRPRPAVRAGRGASVVFFFPSELSAGLTAISRREGATLFMVLLAGFEALLCRLGGGEDMAVGSPIANRNRFETEP
ncbi:non-ribosomal peptide synthetase, partial [bacterium]